MTATRLVKPGDDPPLRVDPGPPAGASLGSQIGPRIEAALAAATAGGTGPSRYKWLADATGGRDIRNNKSVSHNLALVMSDQQGYYLLGFQLPSAARLRRGAIATGAVAVHVKRSGLVVRSRHGVLGNDAPPPRRGTPRDQLLAALASPFASEIGVHVTAVYGQDPKRGAVIHGLLNIDAGGLTFSEAEGEHEAKYDVMAMAFGEHGVVEGVTNPDARVRVVDLEGLRRSGLPLSLSIPVPKPDLYRLQVAFRDAASGRIGSAHQVVRVPDLSKKRLALSGIVLGAPRTGADPGADPASVLRRFAPGDSVSYVYAVYNPRRDSPEAQPDLAVELRLTCDEQPVFTGPAAVDPVSASALVDRSGRKTGQKAFVYTGIFRLSETFAPGRYALQIVATDKRRPATDADRLATQWTDFEVVAPAAGPDTPTP